MASITELRTGIATNLATISGLRTSANLPDMPNPPIAPIGAPEGWQLSLAPAIEYNFNENWGVIAGPWFTVAGKNSSAFIVGMLAINIYY